MPDKKGRGRPRKTPLEKAVPQGGMQDLGVTGLMRFSGIINEEFLLELRGIRGIRVYKEMRDNDPLIGSLLFAIDMLLRSVDWTVEPRDKGNAEDVKAAVFIEECMEDMNAPWMDFITEILSMLVFGWSYFEKVFKIRDGDEGKVPSMFNDGKIGWRKIAIRSQETLERWALDDNGGIQGMHQRGGFGIGSAANVFLPIEKCILFRTRVHKNNPEGRSVLRNAYRPWYFKKNIEQIEGIGIERDLAGLPVVHVPSEILTAKGGTEEANMLIELKKMVRNIRRDEQDGVIFPRVYDKNGNKLFELELLTTGGSRQFDTNKTKQSYSREIALTVLADFILLGHERVGSFALASSKTKLFAVALGGWLDVIQDTTNRHAVLQLLRINNMSGRAKIKHGDIETRELAELGTFIKDIVGAGALIPDNALEAKLRETAGLPSMQADAMQPDARRTDMDDEPEAGGEVE